MHEAVDAVLDLDEGAEIGEIADLAAHSRARGILVFERFPRIGLELLETEGYLLVLLVDVEHDRLDGVADGDDLRRMLHVPRPRHLGDVDQALDAAFELDERPVIGDRHDLAAHLRAARVALIDALPRIRRELLETERDPLPLAIEIEDLDLELVADGDDFRRMAHAAPREIGEMQKPVDAAEVHERAEVGDVLDDPFALLADGELREKLFLLLVALFLENDAARNDDVAAPLVELDDFAVEIFADEIVEIGNLPQRDLRPGQEGVDAEQLHDESALDAVIDAGAHGLAVVVRVLDVVPRLDEVGLFLREDDEAVLVFHLLEVDVEYVPLRDRFDVRELRDGDRTLALEPDVEDDLVARHLVDGSLDDVAFLKLLGLAADVAQNAGPIGPFVARNEIVRGNLLEHVAEIGS